jgi:hypothetical protein
MPESINLTKKEESKDKILANAIEIPNHAQKRSFNSSLEKVMFLFLANLGFGMYLIISSNHKLYIKQYHFLGMDENLKYLTLHTLWDLSNWEPGKLTGASVHAMMCYLEDKFDLIERNDYTAHLISRKDIERAPKTATATVVYSKSLEKVIDSLITEGFMKSDGCADVFGVTYSFPDKAVEKLLEIYDEKLGPHYDMQSIGEEILEIRARGRLPEFQRFLKDQTLTMEEFVESVAEIPDPPIQKLLDKAYTAYLKQYQRAA